VISPTQRTLPDNHTALTRTEIHTPEEFETAIPASVGPQSHAVVGIGDATYTERNFL